MEVSVYRALVTGGTRGIGRAIAGAIVSAGGSVMITGRDQKGVDAAVHSLGHEAGDPAKVGGIVADMRDRAAVDRAVAETVRRFGAIDTLVNNAGIGVFKNVADMTLDEWTSVIDTNLTGVYLACHAAIPHLRARGGGSIINISSLAGKNAFTGAAAYCASKAGLNAFSEALMQEVRYDGIRVSYVMPGSVATGFNNGDETKGADWKTSPDDVAQVVLGLLHSDPRSIVSRVEVRPSKPPRR
jgi:NAD(P)-dependent dehydrogenase (short-subunit alcohol dehydrogenase family)